MINDCCSKCKYLEKINNDKVYARCKISNKEFTPFGLDTRTHLCDNYEYNYDEIECSYNEFIKCPYCGYEDYTMDDFDAGFEDWECPECGKEFNIDVEIKFSISSYPKEKEGN